MNYFIIIRGPLGVGKSTIAKKLAKILDAEYISIDKLLEKYGLDKVEGECIPLINFIKANEQILPLIKEKLAKGKVVIIDGNFYYQEQIKYFIKNLTTDYFVFTLKASLEVCLKRDSARKTTYGEESVKAVYYLVSIFDYGIIINTENRTIDEITQEIKSYLLN